MENASKIMLVEDDPSMRVLLRTLLEIEGYGVVIAPDINSIEEILVTVRGEKPDAILMDVHLRGINGMDVLKEIRAKEDLQNTQVIMTSGMDVRELCMEAGANDFLMKPYMADELLEKLRG